MKCNKKVAFEGILLRHSRSAYERGQVNFLDRASKEQ